MTKISAETCQDRILRFEELGLDLTHAAKLATASMLDDTQSRQIEQGKRLERIEAMLERLAHPLILVDAANLSLSEDDTKSGGPVDKTAPNSDPVTEVPPTPIPGPSDTAPPAQHEEER